MRHGEEAESKTLYQAFISQSICLNFVAPFLTKMNLKIRAPSADSVQENYR